MSEELKECPFCRATGSARIVIERTQEQGGGIDYAFVQCKCTACGPRFADWGNKNYREDAVAAWNSRSSAQSHEAKKGCGKRLAEGQFWTFCGETDMGQTAPALCTECGGEYKLAAQRKGCGRKIHTPDPYSNGKCGFQYMPNELPQLCTECGGRFELAE